MTDATHAARIWLLDYLDDRATSSTLGAALVQGWEALACSNHPIPALRAAAVAAGHDGGVVEMLFRDHARRVRPIAVPSFVAVELRADASDDRPGALTSGQWERAQEYAANGEWDAVAIVAFDAEIPYAELRAALDRQRRAEVDTMSAQQRIDSNA